MSCFGKCSLTVALPIISALGTEVVPLPTGILSTHTGGFEGYIRYDMTQQMRDIMAHWDALDIKFDGIYTGYFAGAAQADVAVDFIRRFKEEGTQVIVDPVMADNGRMYSGFDESFISAITKLIDGADIITPNVTEALLLAGLPYVPIQTPELIAEAEKRLKNLGAKRVVITGVSLNKRGIGYHYFDGEDRFVCEYDRLAGIFYGCGDVFASALCAHVMNGAKYGDAVRAAAEFAEACILETEKNGDIKKYGLCFEKCLRDGLLISPEKRV